MDGAPYSNLFCSTPARERRLAWPTLGALGFSQGPAEASGWQISQWYMALPQSPFLPKAGEKEIQAKVPMGNSKSDLESQRRSYLPKGLGWLWGWG